MVRLDLTPTSQLQQMLLYKGDIDLGDYPSEMDKLSGWEFRTDPESYKTKVLRSGFSTGNLLDQVESILGAGYFNRVVLSMIPAGEEILPHTDDFGEEVRSISRHCHIPVVTDESIVMGFPSGESHLKLGGLYSMDETIEHYVKNPSLIDRIHLLFAWHPHDKELLWLTQ